MTEKLNYFKIIDKENLRLTQLTKKHSIESTTKLVQNYNQ